MFLKKVLPIFVLTLTLSACGFNKPNDPIPGPTPPTPEGEYDVTIYGDYYSNCLSWSNGEDLKNKLNIAMHKGYTALSYDWEIVQNACQAEDDHLMVDQVYSKNNIEKTNTGNASTNPGGWQREHAFPATLMTGKSTSEATKTKGAATDYHNLFASYASGNSSRGNKNFGNALVPIYTPTDASADYRYTNLNPEQGGDPSKDANFEPADYDKGMLSRAILYIATMYKDQISLQEAYVKYSDMDPVHTLAHGNLSHLLNWAKNEVSRKEYWHNETVYTYLYKGVAQGNRNCFVDYPELSEYVFGAYKNSPGQLKYLKPSKLALGIDSEDMYSYAIKDDTTRNYKIGEAFSYNDIKVYGVKKNFASSLVTSGYTVSGVSDGYTFVDADEGTKYITISTPINTIKYPINISNNDIEGASYYVKMQTSEATDKHQAQIPTNPNSGTFTWDNKKWNVNFGNASKASKSGTGVSIGTSTASCGTLTMETVDEINNINYVILTAHTAANKTANLNIYIGGALLKSVTINNNSSAYKPYKLSLYAPISGKVKFEIKNVDAAIHLEYIAINTFSE